MGLLASASVLGSGLMTVGRMELGNREDPLNRIIQSITQGNDSDYAKPEVANRLTTTPETIARIR